MFVCPECGAGQPTEGRCAADGAALAPVGEDQLLGQWVGVYRVARLLGLGGMGRVYKGVHPTIGSRVAIKVLSRECSERKDLVDRFFAEARAVNVIRHETIVNVLDLAMLPDGRPYIVMEYLDGAPLANVIAAHRGTLPLGGMARLAAEVLDALAAAHAKGIVHRDLKPDNVFVSPSGRAKVLDFGIAKLGGDALSATSATATGSLMGTPHYMSPEQAAGKPVDHRADLYALGVILFECATGTKPFVADSLFDLLRQHIEAPPPSARARRPDMPPELDQVIASALAKSPEQRFASAAAMNLALQHATAQLPAEQWAPITGANLGASAGPGNWAPTPPASWARNAATNPTAPPRDTNPTRTDAHSPTMPGASTHGTNRPPRRGLLIGAAIAGVGALVAITAVVAHHAGASSADAGPQVATSGTGTSDRGTKSGAPSGGANSSGNGTSGNGTASGGASGGASSSGNGTSGNATTNSGAGGGANPSGSGTSGNGASGGGTASGATVGGASSSGTGTSGGGTASGATSGGASSAGNGTSGNGTTAEAPKPQLSEKQKKEIELANKLGRMRYGKQWKDIVVTVDQVGAWPTWHTIEGIKLDPARVDSAAFIAIAIAQAHAAVPDTEITRIDLDHLRADGTADLTGGGELAMRFVSRSRAKTPNCELRLEESAKAGLEIRPINNAPCTAAILRTPRCTPAQIYARAHATGDISLSYYAVGKDPTPHWYGPKDRYDDDC